MSKDLVKCMMWMLAAILMLSGGIAQAEYVFDGVVAYWSMDAASIQGKTVTDLVGGNDGEMVGNPDLVDGKIGQALEFDGSNSVDVVGTDALNFNGKEEMTVSAWVNASDDEPVVGVVAGCCGTIVAQRDVAGWALRYDGRNAGMEIEFIVQPGWQGDTGFGAPMFAKGEWHHLTGVVDKDTMRLYLDGQLVIEGPYAGPMSTGGPETDIGHATDGGWVGLIDEVLIYDRALSDDEIRQNFESTTASAVDPAGKLATSWAAIKRAQ